MSEHDNDPTKESHAGEAPETHETREGAQGGAVASPYAAAGAAFTDWFNDRVRRLPKPTVMLGTKLALVLRLHPDGRLECVVETEALEPDLQFVAFESQYLDQLVRKLAVLEVTR